MRAADAVLSLHCMNKPMRLVLKSISEQTGVGFVFQDELINGRNVSCSIDNLQWEQALSEILTSCHLSFRMIPNGPVVIYSDNGKHWMIQGQVVDASTGAALPHANVFQEGTSRGTLADHNGCFTLFNPDSTAGSIRISYIGYQPENLTAHVGQDTNFLTIELREKPIDDQAVTVIAEKHSELRIAERPGQMTLTPGKMDFIPTTGDGNVQRIIQFLPGIRSVYDRPSVLSIYGGAENENLILLDGIPVYKPQNYLGFLNAFHPRAIEKVTVLKGGYPATYGDRLSGIIDLTANTVPENKLNFGAGADLFGMNVFVEMPITNDLHVFISGCRSYPNIVNGLTYRHIYDFLLVKDPMTGSPFKYAVNDQEIIPTALYRFYDITGKVIYFPSSNDRFSATYYQKFEIQNDHWSYHQDSINFDADLTHRWRNDGLSTNWRHTWSRLFRSDFLLVLSQYSNMQQSEEDWHGSLPRDVSVLTSPRVTDRIFKWSNQIVLKTLAVEWGLEWSRQTVDYRWYYPSSQYVLPDSQKVYLTGSKSEKADKEVLFIQNTWCPINRLDLSFGLRGIHISTQTPDPFRDKVLDPRISIQYALTNHWKAGGAWGVYHQFSYCKPDGLQDYVYYPDIQTWELSGPRQKSFISNHWILNLQYETDAFGFYVEAYDKMIQRAPFLNTASGDMRTWSGSVKAVDFTFQKRRGPLSGWMIYSLGEANYRFSDTNENVPIPGNLDRTYEFKSVVNWDVGSFRFSAVGSLASGKPYTAFYQFQKIVLLDGGIIWKYEYGPQNGNRLPPYRRVDIQATKRLGRFMSMNWEIGAAVLNVFDRKNVWQKRYWMKNETDYSAMNQYDITMLDFTPVVFISTQLQ
jgi:outer membrane receptor protein involved in Fe transport